MMALTSRHHAMEESMARQTPIWDEEKVHSQVPPLWVGLLRQKAW